LKVLKDILFKVDVEAIKGSTHIAVESICFDSRLVGKDTLFVAQKGLNFDGHAFIEKAVEDGAKAIVCEVMPGTLSDGVTYVQVLNSSIALAVLASNFYDNPSEKLKLVGVTGTNATNNNATQTQPIYN